MTEEQQPLLAGPSGKKSSLKIKNNDVDSSESLSIKLESIHYPAYGSESGPSGRIIPLGERVTYTWNDINAFAVANESKRRKKYLICGERLLPNTAQKKHILKNVSGVAYPGELLAIMGTSGSGKTTLLNVLTYRTAKNISVTGSRSVNGVPANIKSLTSISAYVQQEDLFIGSLTVKEHLIFQACVRMDKHITYDQRIKRVEEVITELGLKKCENTYIGIPGRSSGISGGEKKRLSFAAEVLTNPSLMFCDEPTSGLDSFMALNVVQLLKSMAHMGKTVVCTIHQPSSELYVMFDKILLLAEGQVVFLGSPQEAEIFFSDLQAPCPRNYNPADYFIQLLAIVPGREESCRQAVSLITSKYERSEQGVRMIVESLMPGKELDSDEIWLSSDHRSPYKASWCAQFRAVLWRSWLSVMKNPNLVKVRTLQTIMVALIIGAIYYGQNLDQNGAININGVIFIFLTSMTFQNIFAVINVFSSELPVFLREHKNGMYRTDVYFLTKTLAEIPLFVILPVIFTAIPYYLIGLNPDITRFFTACGIVILVANVATSLGYLVSCCSSTISMAVSLGSPLVVPFLIFGGYFLNISSIPVYLKWVSYLSWFRYGNEALMINQWKGITQIDCPVENSTCPRNGQMVLLMYSFSQDNLLFDIGCLFGLIIGFRLIAFFALLWKTYK